jgi:hypothetical protein
MLESKSHAHLDSRRKKPDRHDGQEICVLRPVRSYARPANQNHISNIVPLLSFDHFMQGRGEIITWSVIGWQFGRYNQVSGYNIGLWSYSSVCVCKTKKINIIFLKLFTFDSHSSIMRSMVGGRQEAESIQFRRSSFGTDCSDKAPSEQTVPKGLCGNYCLFPMKLFRKFFLLCRSG